MRRFRTWKSSRPHGTRLSGLCWCLDKFNTIECLYVLRMRCRIAGISCSAPAGGELSRFVARVTKVAKVCSMMAVKISLFWRNLARRKKSQPATEMKYTVDWSAPERADHLENNYGARADLTDVVTSEEGLGAAEQLRPPLRKVI